MNMFDVVDILRKLFVPYDRTSEDWHSRNNFRNPIWQNDEDDDEDEDGDFSAIFIPTDIFNLTKSINNTIKMLFNNFPEEAIPDFFDPHSFQSELPQIKNPTQILRDNFFKKDSIESEIEHKQDISLDGKITPENLSDFWKKGESPPPGESLVRRAPLQSCIKSVTSRILSTPEGREERRTVHDCEGNITTTIKKQTADKIHTIIIKKDKNGVETRDEDIIETNKNPLLKDLLLKDKDKPKIDFP